jgi:carboxymethylenebutenolidase
MIEEEIEIQAGDGTAEAVLVRDEDRRRRPGVLLLTDIGGIRAAARKLARRVAERGYTVLVPNVFYRTSRTPLWESPRATMPEDQARQRFAELTKPVTPEAMERDGAAYVDFLAGHPAAGEGVMAVAGYCFTGQMAMRTAAARPQRIAAVASFHGGGLWTNTPASPHLVLPRIKARLYFAHAVEDHSMPAAAIAALNQALAAWGGRFESEVYDGAHHGWTMEDSPVYNQEQAERAFGKLAELLAATL